VACCIWYISAAELFKLEILDKECPFRRAVRELSEAQAQLPYEHSSLIDPKSVLPFGNKADSSNLHPKQGPDPEKSFIVSRREHGFYNLVVLGFGVEGWGQSEKVGFSSRFCRQPMRSTAASLQ
jgi:hypothetical protein